VFRTDDEASTTSEWVIKFEASQVAPCARSTHHATVTEIISVATMPVTRRFIRSPYLHARPGDSSARYLAV
jgi:hypothetical protein